MKCECQPEEMPINYKEQKQTLNRRTFSKIVLTEYVVSLIGDLKCQGMLAFLTVIAKVLRVVVCWGIARWLLSSC